MGVSGNVGGQQNECGTGEGLSPDESVKVEMTVRTALGLCRALTTGTPMAGPGVSPLIQALASVLSGGSPKKNGKGKGGSRSRAHGPIA